MNKLTSWLSYDADSHFSIYNLPFGIFSTAANPSPRAGVAIGDQVIDLLALSTGGGLTDPNVSPEVFDKAVLNDFIALGKPVTNAVRLALQKMLCDDSSYIANNRDKVLVPQADCTMHLPVEVKDYTDFYSSMQHAYNVGVMFRDPANALMPNWKHLPVGYHGRASSIIVSGQDIHRPMGQTKPADGPPVYGPSQRMDFELEMGFIVGKATSVGDRVTTANAADHIFGMVVFNDWSARDIQKWEYVPLGPFLGKSFASSMSPWVVTIEALSPFAIEGAPQDVEILDYLKFEGNHHFDIDLSVSIQPEGGKEAVVSRSNYKYMYWNMLQQLAHHTVNGCNINVGDLMASGTISGETEDSYGSMLELCWAGTRDIQLADGETRKFLKDGDTVAMSGVARRDDVVVGFGEVRTKLLPAK